MVKNSALTYFKMVPFSSPAGSMRSFFSNIYCENLVKLLEINLTILCPSARLGLPEVFSSQTCLRGISSNWLVTDPLVSLCSRKPCLPTLTCLSNFGGNGLPCVLPFPTDPRRVAEFLVCSAFYLLLEWSATSKLLTCATGN